MAIRKPQTLTSIVGDNIVRLRQAKGWTQAELAAKLEIGADSLSRIEHGITGPRFKNLEKLAQILDCPVYELFMYHADIENLQRPQIGPKEEILMLSRRIATLTQQLIDEENDHTAKE